MINVHEQGTIRYLLPPRLQVSYNVLCAIFPLKLAADTHNILAMEAMKGRHCWAAVEKKYN